MIRGFSNGEPQEVASIRHLLDDALGTNAKGLSCHEVSNTIFPDSLWNPQADRQQLYERYRRIMPRVLRDRRNRYGVYFQRMISYGQDATYQGGVNQLEKIIQAWQGGNRRRSAFQVAIFDPRKDNYNQPVRGFPCLQQVAFAHQGSDGFSVTGFYATQYIFERAYGNYLDCAGWAALWPRRWEDSSLKYLVWQALQELATRQKATSVGWLVMLRESWTNRRRAGDGATSAGQTHRVRGPRRYRKQHTRRAPDEAPPRG